MSLLQRLLDFLIHTNLYLEQFTQQYGALVYLVLFIIVFCESGFLFGCFLPGDSLLFASGILTVTGVLELVPLLILLSTATVVGYSVNYWQGLRTGPHIFTQSHKRYFKKEHIERTHQFFERYGTITILFARFIGFVRTFAPFLAGMAKMCPWKFNFYNVVGGVLWIHICVLSGHYLVNNPYIHKIFG